MQLIGKRTVLQQKERVELKHLFLIFPLASFFFFLLRFLPISSFKSFPNKIIAC